MKQFLHRFGFIGITLITLALVGCLLSGTFVVSMFFEDFPKVAGEDDFYGFEVDVTTDSDWDDHKDNIQDIDNVGFELWATNASGEAQTIRCYIAPITSLLDTASSKSAVENPNNTTIVLEIPLLATGQTFIGYADSFSHLTNLETLKAMAEAGQFKFFAMSDANPTDFIVDSIRVVITVTVGT